MAAPPLPPRPPDPPTLAGRLVTLEPMRADHGPALVAAAADGQLWDLTVTVVPGPGTVAAYIARALAGREAGTMLPFVIVRRDSGRIVGSTRFWKLDPVNRKMEIGHTWLSASAQGTGINTEAKFLLLSHAFEVLDAVRVQFTTDERNARSRAAILALGAREEGLIRNERIMPDGRIRNSLRFSIIDSEWAEVRAVLVQKLARYAEADTGISPRPSRV